MGESAEAPQLGFFSFKYKLILAMSVVVGLAAMATFFVVRGQVEGEYGSFLVAQFRSEVEQFDEQQQKASERIKKMADRVREAVRLLAAAEAGDVDSFYADLEYEVEGEIRNLLEEGSEARAFLRYMDHDGALWLPFSEGSNQLLSYQLPELNDYLRDRAALIKQREGLSKAYLPLTIGDKQWLYRVILAPLIDEDFGIDGTILIGLPMDLAQASTHDGQIMSGLLLGDTLYSETISDPMAAVLKERLERERGDERDLGKLKTQDYRVLAFRHRLETSAAFEPAQQIHLYSLGYFDALVAGIRQTLILLSVGVLLVGFFVSWLLSHSLTRPIEELVEGTHRIQQGDYDVHLPVRTHDELGALTRSFNSMGQDLALKERYRDVLVKVSDRDVAEELLNGSLELGGEVRDISILFCDIRGFTPLTEGMKPAEVIEMLNEHMTALTDLVMEYNGVVDKFVGDEIMALFGAPRSYGNDAYNAVNCALAMVRKRAELNEQGRYDINIGIGVGSGEVVAGRMGSENRLNYTVLGENVNLAARLCGKAGPMEVLADDTTYERLEGKIVGREVDDLSLKGFSEGKKAYALRNHDTSDLPA